MKNKEELLKKLNDKEFLKLFAGANSNEDIVKIAKQQGYNITNNDVEDTLLSDDMLESVAGGKGNVTQNLNAQSYGSGNIQIGSQTQDAKTDVSPKTDATKKITGGGL